METQNQLNYGKKIKYLLESGHKDNLAFATDINKLNNIQHIRQENSKSFQVSKSTYSNYIIHPKKISKYNYYSQISDSNLQKTYHSSMCQNSNFKNIIFPVDKLSKISFNNLSNSTLNKINHRESYKKLKSKKLRYKPY